jgi:von Willebrand factor type A domain
MSCRRNSLIAAAIAGMALVGLVPAGCAKVSTAGGSGGTTGTGATGTGSSRGTGSSTGSGSSVGRDDAGLITGEAGTGVCQETMYKFEPQIPTVFVLVDQSGSMFKCRTTGGAMDATGRECANHADTSWYPMRDGVLTVLRQLQADVRFGFAAFTGEMGDAVCPTLNPVLPQLNNQTAIATNYNTLLPPRKGETPTRKALEQVASLLQADHSLGEKFILFVTDGEPDYCDDGSQLCPPDSVVGELQTLQAAHIKTLVMGISSPLTSISDAVLQAFANAGGGQPVLPPFPANQTLDLNAFFDQCNFVAGWKADFAATGKPAVRAATAAGPFATIGDYAAAGGTAIVYKPDVTNQLALVNEISRALSGVKSCTFDLNGLGGKVLRVDMTMLDKVTVKIMGTPVSLDSGNGWRMNSASELELVGAACESWRMPQNMNIDIQVPCAAIVIM